MNIKSSIQAAPAAKPALKAPTQKSEEKGPIVKDAFQTGIEDTMQTTMVLDQAVKQSGGRVLDLVKSSPAQNSAEIKTDLSEQLATAQKRTNIAKYVSTGSLVAGLGGMVGLVALATNMEPAQALSTALTVGGVGAAVGLGAAVAETVYDKKASTLEGQLKEVKNWESFLQNKDKVPAQPNLGAPIERDAFMEALEKHGTAPHPCPEEFADATGRADASGQKTYSGTTDTIQQKLQQTESDARADRYWSVGESFAGVALMVGGVVGAATGHIPPAVGLGMLAAGPFLVVDGVNKEEKFKGKVAEAKLDQAAVAEWTNYLSGAKKAS